MNKQFHYFRIVYFKTNPERVYGRFLYLVNESNNDYYFSNDIPSKFDKM
jgi:hypothetical protein